MKKIFGFIFADDMEYKPFSEYAFRNNGVVVAEKPQNVIKIELEDKIIYGIESGVGKVNSAIAALELIKTYNVNYILSAGLSGAISGLHREDIVAGTRYMECDFDIRAFGYELGRKPGGVFDYLASDVLLAAAKKVNGMKFGDLGTGDFFLNDAQKKQEYLETFKINAFDMESGSIAAACDKYGIPFMSIRKISDDADDTATGDYRDMNELAEETLTEILMQVIANVE